MSLDQEDGAHPDEAARQIEREALRRKTRAFLLLVFALFIAGIFPIGTSPWWLLVSVPVVLFPGLVLYTAFFAGPRMAKAMFILFVILLPLAVMLALAWGFVSLLGTTPGFVIGLICGLCAIAVVVTGLATARLVRTGFAAASPALIVAGWFLACFGLWSLMAAGLAVFNAERIAWGSPYCIADTSGESGQNYNEIRGIGSLRGAYFYTTATGYKSTSRWWMHGVLIAPERGAGVWNWSLRKMSFDPLRNPKDLLIPVGHPCTPRPHYALTIGLW